MAAIGTRFSLILAQQTTGASTEKEIHFNIDISAITVDGFAIRKEKLPENLQTNCYSLYSGNSLIMLPFSPTFEVGLMFIFICIDYLYFLSIQAAL